MPSADGDPQGSEQTEPGGQAHQSQEVDEFFPSEEAYTLVTNLEPDLALRVRLICLQRRPEDPDELWHDACFRILQGKRSISRTRPLGVQLAGILKSIDHEHRKKLRRNLDLDSTPEALLVGASNPLQELIVRDEPDQMQRAVLALFADDPRCAALAKAIFAAHEVGDSLEGEEIRLRAGISEEEFDTVRRQFRRVIKKAFPKGWSS
jgi:hypothetical protein